MRIGWVLVGLLACGGADAPPPVKPVVPTGDPALTFGAGMSLPSSSEGVVPTAPFGVHVRVVDGTAEYGTGGTVRGTLAADEAATRQSEFSAAMAAASTPTCGRGTKRVVGTREPPQADDTIVFAESTLTSDIPAGFLFMSRHRAVLAIRQLGARETAVLPFRFCGADADSSRPASSIDIAATDDGQLTFMPSSGAGSRVAQLPVTTSVEDLAMTLRTIAAERPIARVRVSNLFSSGLSAQHLVDILSAAATVGAQIVDLQFADRAGDQLAVTIGGIARPTHVDPARVRQAIMNTGASLLDCYEHAAYTLPTLDGSVAIQVAVAPDGKVVAKVDPIVGDEMASCVQGVFESLKIDGVRKSGSFVATIDLKRSVR